MRADLSTIQQTLTAEAAAALGRAIEEAGRRRHGQTTPLHVAAALLAAPAGLLRVACARAGVGAGAGAGAAGHPLQCRALELCFSVALDRLPAAAAGGAAPPVSNALVAALKRAQAQQRRGCPEAAQQPLLAVKVELEQLVLSMLDDPSVSRVMREASFSSAAVKATIEQILSSSPSTAPAPTSASFLSPSPLPLAAARSSNGYINPRLAAAASSGGGGSDDAKKVLDVLLRPSRRNPILVGDAGPDAVLRDALRRIPASACPALAGAKILAVGAELAALAGDKAAVAARVRELGAVVDALLRERGGCGGVVLDLGDLKWLVEGPAAAPAAAAAASSEAEKAAVAEMGRLLKRLGKEVWAVGTAACATYLRCQVYHPAMEAEWDLQAVPIAPRRLPLSAAFPRLGGNGILGSSAETLSPMRGLMAGASARAPLRWPPPASVEPAAAKPDMCQLCKGGYERELGKLVAERMDKQASQPEAAANGLPHWLQLGTDQTQPKEQELRSKKITEELEKRWRETCARLHPPPAKKPLALPALSVPLAGFGPRLQVEPKLALARAAAASAPALRLSTNWEKPAVVASPELRRGPPGSPVKTDLVLGRLEGTEKAPKCGLTEGLTDLQKAKIAGISDIESFKHLLKGLTEKVSWQSDAASAIAAVVIQCRSGSGKRPNWGHMWLLFVGPDQVGKRKMASALSEHMASTSPVIVNFGSDVQPGGGTMGLNMGFWGKTSLDHVTDAVRQNPFSVIVLEGIDQADMVVRGKIERAMQTGRLADSRGREVSLGNVILILTANWVPDELSGSTNESLLQCEEKMLNLGNSSWRLELSVCDKPAKHRADWLCDNGRPAKQPKELSSGLGLSLDLNLAVGGSDDTDGSRNSSDVTVEHEHEKGTLAAKCLTSSPVCDLLELVDDAIVFRPVDFGPLRKTVLDRISAKFESMTGSQFSFRIDNDAVDRIVSTIWLTDEKFDDWADKVLGPSIERLKRNLKGDNGCAVVRLAAIADKALQRRGGLPTTVTIAVDGST